MNDFIMIYFIQITTELLQGIRIVKFYAWELPFVKTISNIFISIYFSIKCNVYFFIIIIIILILEKFRDEELKHIRSLSYSRAILVFIMSNIITVIIGK